MTGAPYSCNSRAGSIRNVRTATAREMEKTTNEITPKAIRKTKGSLGGKDSRKFRARGVKSNARSIPDATPVKPTAPNRLKTNNTICLGVAPRARQIEQNKNHSFRNVVENLIGN